MKVGLLTRNENAWCSNQLKESFKKQGFETFCFTFEDLVARVGLTPSASFKNLDLSDLDTLLVRPIGRGSLEQIIFRLNLLQKLSRSSLKVINNPSAIEKAADFKIQQANPLCSGIYRAWNFRYSSICNRE